MTDVISNIGLLIGVAGVIVFIFSDIGLPILFLSGLIEFYCANVFLSR